MSSFRQTVLIVASVSALAKVAAQRLDDTSLLQSTSLRLLYQNNLNASDDGNHAGAILLDSMTRGEGEAACNALDESLIYKETLQNYSSDYFYLLSYVESAGYAGRGQQYWMQDNVVTTDEAARKSLSHIATSAQASVYLFCARRATGPVGLMLLLRIAQRSGSLQQGIRYANQPERFEYSTMYDKTGNVIDATQYGSNCPQAVPGAPGAEDCLFLNIQTPYIPKTGSTYGLRPVIFSIHGGGFLNGNGRGTTGQDGGNLASREDIVAVQINYRLGTLGFLALNGTGLNGNYGLGDQVTALQWVQKHIASFGGDPGKITIAGASAGAASVRALLGSPPVIEGNLIAGAIAQSSPGGGVSLGLNGNYATPFSTYLTIEQSATRAGEQIFQEAGCNQANTVEKIKCLKAVPATQLATQKNIARYIVQDGHFVKTSQLVVNKKSGNTAHVPVIFGVNTNDGASLGSTYPKSPVSTLVNGIQQALGISLDQAQSVIDSGLFPIYDTGNPALDSFNVSQRIATDITFRCISQATAYAGSKSGAFPKAFYYEFDRTYRGIDFNNLGAELTAGPVEPGYSAGNPSKPYFKIHGGEGGFTYGNQNLLRDGNDLLASQLASSYFASFVKTGDPNPDAQYLTVRGYTELLEQVQRSEAWDAVSGETGPAKSLNGVAPTVDFPDLEQCAWLKYPISYYHNGGQ